MSADIATIRDLLTALLAQVNELLADFEQRSLLEHQTTRGQLIEIRDTLQEELDTRMSVAFSEIDEIKAARDDLAAAVALVRGVQQELARLAAYLDRMTPRRLARLCYSTLALSLVTLALLALHAYQMAQTTITSLAGG